VETSRKGGLKTELEDAKDRRVDYGKKASHRQESTGRPNGALRRSKKLREGEYTVISLKKRVLEQEKPGDCKRRGSPAGMWV